MTDLAARLRPRNRRDARLLAGVLACAVVAGVGLAALIRQSEAGSAAPAIVTQRFGMEGMAAWAPGAKPAPPITTLTDQAGQRFALSSLHGHTVELVFFDSHCKQLCPLEGRELAAAETALPAAQRPVLVAVSVNRADTPASVARAMAQWGLAKLAPWYWLMGSRRNLSAVWAAYHIYVSPKPVNGDIQHTEAVYLINKQGYERSAYLYPFGQRFVTHDLKVLARS